MTMMQGLPLTGVSLSANARKKGELWLSSCMTHVTAMHKLISSVYDGLESDDVYDEDSDESVAIPVGNSDTHTQMFADYCYKLIKLMREPTNGPVELPVSNMIRVLTRCLKVSYSDVLSVPSRVDLVSLLPRLHQSCMDVLSQLILCCGGDILHLSHVIVDLCLQTFGSAAKMSSDAKCCTRSSTYQALVFWVRMCGWGKYLTSHSKVFIQQIIADTEVDTDDRLGKVTEADGTKPKDESIGRKRKGGKKKKGGKGDSYLELEVEEDGNRKERCSENRLELVQWAFSFSQFMVENLPFSTGQNLIVHIVKTASTVQRLSLHLPEPYRKGEARKGLYQAVAACLLSPLTYGCNRNDAVSHYQLTNQAMDLLARACHGEEAQIKTVALQSLDILRSSSNLKGPVIRKALDFEDTSVEDISELMREKELMTDSIEDLRHKLMTSEMENEQQSRLISTLREQIAGLQSKISTGHQDTSSINSKSRISQQDDNNDDDDEEEEEEEEDDSTDEAEDETSKEETSLALHHDDRNNENITGGGSTKAESLVLSNEPNSSSEKLKPTSSNKSPRSSNTTEAKEDDLKKSVQKMETNVMTSKKSSKRTKPKDDPNPDLKRTKIDVDTNQNKEVGDGVECMLLDFVDAPPDS